MSTNTISTMLQSQIKIGLLREIFRRKMLTEEQFSELIKRLRK